MNLNDYIEEIHQTAKDKGWWDKPRSALEVHALIHSEISEATEAVRDRIPSFYIENICVGIACKDCNWYKNKNCMSQNKVNKPEGEAVELVDAVIRILDWYGHENIEYSEKWKESGDNTLVMEYIVMSHGLKGIEHEGMLHQVLDYSIYGWDNLIYAILYMFRQREWDFEEVLKAKMAYNKTRPYRHGKELKDAKD